MISRLRGILISRELDRIEVATPGGVVYEAEIPFTVFERLPHEGQEVEIRTYHMVREDSATLYGFLEDGERELFTRLLSASGVGGKLALAMLSAYSARRLARALAEKDVQALTQVSGVGKKTAERLALELADKVQDLALGDGLSIDVEGGAITHEAVAALVALGYTFTDADEAIRQAVADGTSGTTDEIVRRALQKK